MNLEYVYPILRCKTEESNMRDYLYKKRLEVVIYKDVYGLPYRCVTIGDNILVNAGGLQANGEMVRNSSICDDWAVGYDFDTTDAVNESQTVVFIGFISDCWGHAITDSMSKLWWLQTDEYFNKYKDSPIYYWGPKPLNGNFLDLLCLAGVPAEKMHYMNQLTHFRMAIVPDNCYKRLDSEYTPRMYTLEYVRLIDVIVEKCSRMISYEKVFMIRPSDSRQYTCKRIYSILKKNNYVFIDPTHCSVNEQVSIFQNAKEIIVEESSVSHNAIFCKNGAKLVILRKCNNINEFQASINRMRNLNVTYIDCNMSVLTRPALPSEGPFFLYANKEFCRFMGVDYSGFPYDEFRNWLKYHNYFIEDVEVRTKRLQWDTHYAEIFAQELTYTRKHIERKMEWIKHLPVIPKFIKERGFVWVVKKYVRNLM